MAVAISSRSSDRTRLTMFSRAASNARPRLTSRTTRPNSTVIGACASRTTIAIACRNDDPARRAFAMSVIVSGNCLLKALSRPVRRRPSHIRGIYRPMKKPMISARGEPRGCSTMLSMRKIIGTASAVAAQKAMNSPGLSLRSARAMSRARLAPKSRCSTTRFRRARATLWARMSPMPADCLAGVAEAVISVLPAVYRSSRALIPPPRREPASPRTSSITPTKTMMPRMGPSMTLLQPRSVREAEEAARQMNTHDFELLYELGPDTGGPQATLDLAFNDARLLEQEYILHHDDITFHTLDLGDVLDSAGAVLHTGLVNDQIHGRRDLLSDGPQRQVNAGH